MSSQFGNGNKVGSGVVQLFDGDNDQETDQSETAGNTNGETSGAAAVQSQFPAGAQAAFEQEEEDRQENE